MSLADELQKLNELKQSEAISEQDYEQAKDALLAQNRLPGSPMTLDSNTWGAMIHLSQFCAYLLPLAGIIVPLVLWQMKNDESPIIDRHGKIVMNWILSQFVYLIIAGILCFILIGFPLFILLSIVGLVFPIIGTIKAGQGEIWPYPCSIPFFK